MISLYSNLLTDNFQSFIIKDSFNTYEETLNWIKDVLI